MINGSRREGAVEQARIINEVWRRQGVEYNAYPVLVISSQGIWGVRSKKALRAPK